MPVPPRSRGDHQAPARLSAAAIREIVKYRAARYTRHQTAARGAVAPQVGRRRHGRPRCAPRGPARGPAAMPWGRRPTGARSPPAPLASPGSRHRGGISTGSGTVLTRFGIRNRPMWAAHAQLGGSRATINGPSALQSAPVGTPPGPSPPLSPTARPAVSPPAPRHRPAPSGSGPPEPGPPPPAQFPAGAQARGPSAAPALAPFSELEMEKIGSRPPRYR